MIARSAVSPWLRSATIDDRTAIRAIVRAARINPTGLDWRRFLVAEFSGEIVGVGQVKPHGDGSRELASIAVVPAMQSRGIGSSVITALLDRESGPIHLVCRQPLERYYQRFGFVRADQGLLPESFRRSFPLIRFLARFLRGHHLIVMRREAVIPSTS